MLSEYQIINQFRNRGMTRGGELYLRASDATEFLRACQANNIAIIGVEGFIYDEQADTITPVMDYIRDYTNVVASTWEEFKDSCNQNCLEFLLDLPVDPALVFYFYLLKEQ